ncbi:hypothetical protein [Nocardia higoensis]|uniref:hypothetical protein n=1 Tax=Nocardia higoensis TaxID=228599 RepID=UPI0005934EB2|nr:hypothetical protein [Nocardia higoensis]
MLREFGRVFDILAQRILGIVGGEPDQRWSDPSAGVRRDLPNGMVITTVSPEAIYVELVSPEYQAWLDEIDRSREED